MPGMEEHTSLVNQGTFLMLDRVLKDLQVVYYHKPIFCCRRRMHRCTERSASWAS